MLRRHPIKRAALVALALLPILAGGAFAGNAPIGGGGSCVSTTEPQDSTQGQQQAYDDGLYTCTGTSWAAEAFIVGGVDQSNSVPSCNSTNAGMVKYSSGTFYGCNGSSWVPMDSGMHFISTQTASSSASLQFTNLPSTYNTLFLNCSGLVMNTAGSGLAMEVGEGSGGSFAWKTTAHYTSINDQIANASDIFDGMPPFYTTTIPVSMKFYMDNPGSSSVVKQIWGTVSGGVNNPTGDNWVQAGWWNNDTNPVTGWELVGVGGTITSGTCSLYGMN